MPYMDRPALPVPPGRPADPCVKVGIMEVRMGGVQFREGAPGVLQAPVCIFYRHPLGSSTVLTC